MKLQDLQKLHPDGHDFRIICKEYQKTYGSGYLKTIWVEWTENGNFRLRHIYDLTTSYIDNEYNFELDPINKSNEQLCLNISKYTIKDYLKELITYVFPFSIGIFIGLIIHTLWW